MGEVHLPFHTSHIFRGVLLQYALIHSFYRPMMIVSFITTSLDTFVSVDTKLDES